ncbi:MAG: hypothetical protein QOC89_913 [Paraburkholderia sp.]|uniref:DUF2934 domain-containing protein n=1 Tax=Paraburkholderia sp. TaxID=1926495 RepID=UPI002B003C6D|nr:DUF2934 domain-containing protein [Paraburkholderia sp.]MEA3083216.1 hypothetical protein [Paraburkholderia sp.]
MDTQMTEEELRSLAYRLWERAGCPDGRADEFWEQARLQLGSGGSPTQGDRMNDSDEFVDAPEVLPSEPTSTVNPGRA